MRGINLLTLIAASIFFRLWVSVSAHDYNFVREKRKGKEKKMTEQSTNAFFMLHQLKL
jgi:hypothetical protein